MQIQITQDYWEKTDWVLRDDYLWKKLDNCPSAVHKRKAASRIDGVLRPMKNRGNWTKWQAAQHLTGGPKAAGGHGMDVVLHMSGRCTQSLARPACPWFDSRV